MSIGGTFRAGAIPAGTSVAAGGVIALAGLPALASSIDDAEYLFKIIFWICYESLNISIKAELESIEGLSVLGDGCIPVQLSLSGLLNEFDDKYFEVEDDGDMELSDRFFKKARILAAFNLINFLFLLLNKYCRVVFKRYTLLMSSSCAAKGQISL